MKNWLYHFDVKKDVEKTVEEKSQDKDGNEITISKKVIEQVPTTFSIQKPTRKIYENAELFYAVKLSEGIKAGLLTRALLAKRYKNDGGPMSEPEKERYAEVYYQMLVKQEALEKLKLNLEGKTEEERARQASVLMADLIDLQEEITSFENQQQTLFDQTAENRAKNATIMWWVLNLAHKKEGEGYVSVFGEGDYDARLEIYDEIEEKNDAFWTEVIKKFAYFTTFWYTNGVTTEEEFKQVENLYNRDAGLEAEPTEEELEEEAKAQQEAEEKEAELKKAEAEAEAKKQAEAEAETKEEPKAEEPKAEESTAEDPKVEKPRSEGKQKPSGSGKKSAKNNRQKPQTT
mgnify:CR=1 FL=1